MHNWNNSVVFFKIAFHWGYLKYYSYYIVLPLFVLCFFLILSLIFFLRLCVSFLLRVIIFPSSFFRFFYLFDNLLLGLLRTLLFTCFLFIVLLSLCYYHYIIIIILLSLSCLSFFIIFIIFVSCCCYFLLYGLLNI